MDDSNLHTCHQGWGAGVGGVCDVWGGGMGAGRGDYLDRVQKLDVAALKTGKKGHSCPKNWTKTGHFSLIPICRKCM